LGYDGDESWTSGEEWSKRVHPDDMKSITASMQAHFEGKTPNAGGEFRMLCKDGSWKWVLGRGMVVRRAKDGKPLRLVGTNSDITKQKEAEKNLREAKDIAENATRLKDQFVSLVAHDLRSPFNSILGFLKLMEKDTAPPLHEKHKAMTKRLIDTSAGMINMVDEILNISRLQTGSMVPKRTFFDARPLAARMINNIEHLANAKHIKIVNFLPSGMRLFADQQLFGEVLSNLLSNAIKFSHDGGKVTVFSPEGKYNVVGIKDNGLGVAADILPDLFKTEVKTTSLGTMGEKGTGLGLPLCFEIMKIHGGNLSAESAVGEGTVFYAELPPKTPVVLVVEDSDMSRDMMKDMLELLQVNIIEARTGEEALETIAKSMPDLILLDIILPGIDGFTVLEKFRKMEGATQVPVLIITSDNNEETRIKGFELGAQDFIPKPFERENLFPRIMRFIG
jgi:PAS domain S-box-containing protein